MSMGEVTRMIRYHDKDLYLGDGPGNPPITQRLKSLEDHNAMVAADLYDRESGLVPMLRSFFAVLGDREKKKDGKLARYMVIISLAALLAPWIHDIMKATFGK
jgi:hypothetical protein